MINLVRYHISGITINDVLYELNYLKNKLTSKYKKYLNDYIYKIQINIKNYPENLKHIFDIVLNTIDRPITRKDLEDLTSTLEKGIKDNQFIIFLQNQVNISVKNAETLHQNLHFLLENGKMNISFLHDLITIWNNQACNTKLFQFIQNVSGLQLIGNCNSASSQQHRPSHVLQNPKYLSPKQQKQFLFEQVYKNIMGINICGSNNNDLSSKINILDSTIKLCNEIILIHNKKFKGGSTENYRIHLMTICAIMHQNHIKIQDIQRIRDALVMVRNHFGSSQYISMK